MNTYDVETYNTKTGEVIHGYSFNTVGPETAKARYMAQPDRPQLIGDLDVRVTLLKTWANR